MKNLLIIFIALCLFSCSEREKKEILPIEIEPLRIISELDTMFFVKTSFSADQDRNYIVNQSPAFLVATNKEYEPIWGNFDQGNGPEDLYFPEGVKLINEQLYVLDHGNQSIKLYDPVTGKFISSIKSQERFMQFRFEVSRNKNIFLSVYSQGDTSSVIEIDQKGNVLKRYGSVFPAKSSDMNRQMKYFQLDENDNVILIGSSLPFVDILNKQGVRTNRFDLSKFEPIKRSLDTVEVRQAREGVQSSGSIPTIIIDAQYTDKRLYLSFTDRIGLDRSKARNLLVFKLDKDICELEQIIKFKTGTEDDGFHPSHFFVDSQSKKLYVQGLITNQLYEFDLPKI